MKVMPRKSVPRMSDIQINVTPALRLRGSRKAVVPLEIASTPVSAVVPLEKACSKRKSDMARTSWIISRGGGLATCPRLPVK